MKKNWGIINSLLPTSCDFYYAANSLLFNGLLWKLKYISIVIMFLLVLIGNDEKNIWNFFLNPDQIYEPRPTFIKIINHFNHSINIFYKCLKFELRFFFNLLDFWICFNYRYYRYLYLEPFECIIFVSNFTFKKCSINSM